VRLNQWCEQIHKEFDLTSTLNDIDD